jgi:hypothetical protein
MRRDPTIDYLAIGFFVWLGILFWALAWTIPVPIVRAPDSPDAPLLHLAAALPALPTNLDSTWRPTRRHGAYRGITGEWIVRR